MFALTTVEHSGKVLACLEVNGRYFPLSHFEDLPDSVIALFEDWDRYEERLHQAAKKCDLNGGLEPSSVRVLAPLQFPGKVLCAGATVHMPIATQGLIGKSNWLR